MKVFLFLFVSLILIHPCLAEDDEELLGKAVNKAGMQRMLTQRLAKSYLAVLTKTNMHAHLSQIEADIKAFEMNYTQIKAMRIITPKVLSDIKVAEKAWDEYKKLISTAPSIEEASLVLEMNTTILDKCHKVVLTLEKLAKKIGAGSDFQTAYGDLAYLTNISGRQRMLSQRVMLFYLAKCLKIDNKSVNTNLEKAISMYSTSLDKLMGSLENTPEIDFKLVRLVGDWKKLEVICKNLDDIPESDLSNIIAMGDLLLSEMDLVTKMYEELVDTHIASLMLGNAVNKAGRQRMLTQKIAKSYFALTLNISPEDHKKELQESKALFTKSLDELLKYAPMPEITDALHYVQDLWKQYDDLTTDMTNMEENAQKILANNTQLLRACHNVVLMLKVYAKTLGEENVRFDNELVGLIDKSGRQRMLSQRMVLYCMASSWSKKVDDVDKNLDKTVRDYGKALEELSKNPSNTSEIQAKLKAVRSNWNTVEEMCSMGGEDRGAQMLTISNQLLKDMDQVTNMYEQIISRLMDTEALNKAGRQRMLTQRIALDALAINMNLDTDLRQQDLKKNITLFSRQLDELKIYLGSSNYSKNSMNKVVALWKNYKKYAQGSLNSEDITKLVEMNKELLDACHQVVLDMLDNNQNKESRATELINIAGHQRMLSQRITLHALSFRKGIKQDLCKKVLAESIKNFKSNLTRLEQSSMNTPEIFETLEKTQKMLLRIEKYVQNLEQVDLYQILMTSNILLSDTEMLTKAYEDLSKKRPSQN